MNSSASASCGLTSILIFLHNNIGVSLFSFLTSARVSPSSGCWFWVCDVVARSRGCQSRCLYCLLLVAARILLLEPLMQRDKEPVGLIAIQVECILCQAGCLLISKQIHASVAQEKQGMAS